MKDRGNLRGLIGIEISPSGPVIRTFGRRASAPKSLNGTLQHAKRAIACRIL